jgi:6-phosphogluconolactonase/glucosamine-6-phosphate isomerase/deaminase
MPNRVSMKLQDSKIHNIIFQNSIEASRIVAKEIVQLVKSKQAKNKSCVLGLATGPSPIKVYEELVRLHKKIRTELQKCCHFQFG